MQFFEYKQGRKRSHFNSCIWPFNLHPTVTALPGVCIPGNHFTGPGSQDTRGTTTSSPSIPLLTWWNRYTQWSRAHLPPIKMASVACARAEVGDGNGGASYLLLSSPFLRPSELPRSPPSWWNPQPCFPFSYRLFYPSSNSDPLILVS